MELKGVTIGYSDKNIAESINIKFNKNELSGLIGRSGCGKSTLLKSFFDFSIIKKGDFLYNGKDISKFTKNETKKYKNKIFYLRPENNLVEFLDFYQNVLNNFNNYKNCIYKFFKILTKEQKQELFNILKELEVEDLAFEKVSNLSSGQKQRLSIAQMLFNRPEIILADEPTSNLDIVNTKLIFDILNRYKIDAYIIIAIHDLTSATSKFDRLFAFQPSTTEIIEVDCNDFDIEKLGKYYYE
ncbi:phosphate/phosphonate ABC transporter, ATP-binding protein PhnC [Mycoplasmopsis canis PG 14]|uniref:Alkylphosphonate ABC transporter, ATP-binding component n=1 Tax=Mycoplasmopsis canis TaxID=29555 RepID=A0A449AQ76_9BACT|nr:ATP-binding cassette domain-containing protein [Mycoplasmopsis canis]AMD81319.1 phosphate starvation-inducible protein PhoH [Mycoplasmopsis canis PG 14]EIE40538.1 phosphate/phosphonate ABC transporter, ATP-binding protein PhnC [Mycoplasmopsis canis PG 14]VEU68708.1 Alkylphosphonate ABC transporter, ATP-binding component [Mycoplasmopsis canis]